MGEADELKENTLEMLRQMFHLLDSDNSGCLSLEELEQSVMCNELQEYFSTLGMEGCEAKALFDLLDYRGVGEVAIDDFVAGCLRIKGHIKNVDICTILFQNKRLLHLLTDARDELAATREAAELACARLERQFTTWQDLVARAAQDLHADADFLDVSTSSV
eukprot:NODE_6149_length_526_cov_259.358811.p1 GENE.NODE_6149_length_526_cov_259.358811~~NODE_6149_length_526_cov_259.358811.p1  ORF type:complete len:162 (-),score=84.43 NODE_6149_length_526_cov_259.358811:23-508(-)